MIKFRTAGALAVGAVAALALGGTALAATADEDRTARTTGAATSPLVAAAVPAPSGSATSEAPAGQPSQAPSQPGEQSQQPSQQPGEQSQGAAELTRAQAEEIALRAAGGGQVEDAEQEKENGRAVWDVEIQNGTTEHEIDVDRATGEIVQHEKDQDDDRDNDD